MKRYLVVCILIITALVISACGAQVPDVEGMTPDEAAKVLTTAGFEVASLSYDESSTDRYGTIVGQRPEAGRRADDGSVVSLTVAGPPPVEVPDVRGLTSDEASAALAATGLVSGDTSEQYSATVKRGCVITLAPLAGEMAPQGSPVTFVVSKGPEPVAIPKLKGKTEAQARELLEGAGFKPKIVREHDLAKKGTVISQKPSKGKALPGTKIKVVVSRGVEMVRVPNVVGTMNADAIIRAAGLVPKSIPVHGPIDPDAAGFGEAYRQRPAAGSLVPKGSTVSYRFWWEMG